MRGDILGLERRRRWSDKDKLEIVLSVGVPDHAQIIEGNCVEIVPEDLAIAETACTVASDAYPPVMQAAPGV